MASNKSLGTPCPFGLLNPFPASITSSQQHLHTLICYLESAAFSGCFSAHLSSTQGTQITLGRREAELQRLMPGAYSMSHCFCFLMDSAEPSGDLRTTAVLGFMKSKSCQVFRDCKECCFLRGVPWGSLCFLILSCWGREGKQKRRVSCSVPLPVEVVMHYMSQPLLPVSPQELQPG